MVRDHFNMDWVFSLQRWLGDIVEKNYRADRPGWPTLTSFDSEIFAYDNRTRLFVIRDKPSAHATPSVSSGRDVGMWPAGMPKPENPFDVTALMALLDAADMHFGLRQQDYAILIPNSEGQNIDEDLRLWSPEADHAVTLQMNLVVQRHLHYVRGFDRVGNFLLPPGYEFLARECERFFNDHPHYDRNVFLMTRFVPGNKMLVKLDTELRRVLREHDLNPVRADDKMYLADRNLWNNVCVYMLCCSRGIAILEDRLQDEFNPNVALEYGFMRALNRSTLLLADSAFRNLRADVIGTLRETFDLTDIESTVQPALERWLNDFR